MNKAERGYVGHGKLLEIPELGFGDCNQLFTYQCLFGREDAWDQDRPF